MRIYASVVVDRAKECVLLLVQDSKNETKSGGKTNVQCIFSLKFLCLKSYATSQAKQQTFAGFSSQMQ